MEIVLALAVGAVCIISFVVGAKVGQKVVKGEDIRLPSINPMEHIAERRERKEAEREQDRVNTILANIERYDGTGKGQEDIPRG